MKAYLEIEMPRCCNKCPMLVYEGHVLCICRALPAIEEGEILKPWKNRRKDCPLKPIQPHGRLIDADALVRELYSILVSFGSANGLVEGGLNIAISTVNGMSTIIPAEEGE